MVTTFIFDFRRILILIFLFIFYVDFQAQKIAVKYENGIQKGVVKVKFTPLAEKKLGKTAYAVNSSGFLETGIATFDATVRQMNVKKMERLFPYDPKNEYKLIKHGLNLWYIVELDGSEDVSKVVSGLKKLGEVNIVEPFYEKELIPYTIKEYKPVKGTREALPFNDPGLKDQWHYKNTGQTGYKGGADINLFEAWTKTAGKSDIIVSVHDEGVDVNHEDLKANIWINYAELNGTPGVDDDGNGYIDDIYGFNFDKGTGKIDAQTHGTHVAGTIAAVNNNGIGVSGVAGGTGNNDGVKIMSLQALGGGPIERTYTYAANNGAVISQNSWGYVKPDLYEQSVLDAIDYFIEEAGDYNGSPMKGGIVIFAAGNDNDTKDKWYPAYYEKVMSVSSLQPNWKKASYSNYGDWVDIAAPGGETALGEINGVLSTLPNNRYGYLQGTSMACPHVSGVAALALAARTNKMVNKELWGLFNTSVVDIDKYNPDFIGKLGIGAIDASLAVKNNFGSPPDKIENLEITGISQEFAVLKWTVPADEDDGKPIMFNIYYSTEPIDENNLSKAIKLDLNNDKEAGEVITYQVSDLSGLTKYYFAVKSVDRWLNRSELSNVVSAVTNEGSSIDVDENSKSITFDLEIGVKPIDSHQITILNNSEGLLRWSHLFRNTSITLSAKSLANINYPKAKAIKSLKDVNLGYSFIEKDYKIEPKAFTKNEKAYVRYISGTIGEMDIDFPNSSATKFLVTEQEGFNLTTISAYLKISKKSTLVVEIYKGDKLKKENLVYVQEYEPSIGGSMINIDLKEQIYIENGEVFWVVIHVPSGNKFPLGIGEKTNAAYSEFCYFSSDVGQNWTKLREKYSDKYAWAVIAKSNNPDFGNYLVLTPAKGEVNGNKSTNVELEVNGTKLINGTYTSNLILTSNDSKNKELRIPVTVKVRGQQPLLKYPDIVDFGNVFLTNKGTQKVEVLNEGYGNFNDISYSINDPQFKIVSNINKIEAKDKAILEIAYEPISVGSANAELTISNGNQTYSLPLFGIGLENSKIVIDPEQQSVDNLTLGDVVEAEITVKNEGAYLLKYFVPGYDSKGISDGWPSRYHLYGYSIRNSDDVGNTSLNYAFKDISATGKEISDVFKTDISAYEEVKFGFQFPYYDKVYEKIYISQFGFLSFDNSMLAPNVVELNSDYTPKGCISIFGTYINLFENGKIFYKVERDRLIVQFDKVGTNSSITAQVVLHSDGNIRFYYDTLDLPDFGKKYLNIFIEDYEKKDGFLIHSSDHVINLHNKLALGLDFPGPDVIVGIENGSGKLMPNQSSTLKVKLDTGKTTEGRIKRLVNFITNDPLNKQKSAQIDLNIVRGGNPEIVYSQDTIDFGNIFKDVQYQREFSISNQGNGIAEAVSISFNESKFAIEGELQNVKLNPKSTQKYNVKALFNGLGKQEDYLIVKFSDNTEGKIYVIATVLDSPKLKVETLDLLERTLRYGERAEVNPFSITNEGNSDLIYSITGEEWFKFVSDKGNEDVVGEVDYEFKKHNKDDVYNWIDIVKTGEHIQQINENGEYHYWHTIELPFPIKYYGKEYAKIKLAQNGIITVNEEDPDYMLMRKRVPTDDKGGYIMPLWMPSGFDSSSENQNEMGIFYQFYNDKIVVSWERMSVINMTGYLISAQVIFYKNGEIKFQYKKPLNTDFLTQLSFVGLQKPGADKYLAISNSELLEHEKGLAYVINPVNQYILPPGETISGNIVLDATNIYAGEYNGKLKIGTNDPANLLQEKPIKLTVTGDPELILDHDVIDFGKKELGGGIETYNLELSLKNVGTGSIILSDAKLEKGDQYLDQLILRKIGWLEQWVSISEIFTDSSNDEFVIRPGETFNTRITFIPEDAGKFEEKVSLTTNLGVNTVILRGEAFYPPKIDVDRSVVSVSVNNLNTQEKRQLNIKNSGKYNLQYQANVEYQRRGVRGYSVEGLDAGVEYPLLKILSNNESGEIESKEQVNFTQELKYFSKVKPDTYIGLGGNPFIAAVKFKTGDKNFNLSDIGVVMSRENMDKVKLLYEVRAGGVINSAPVILKGESEHIFNSLDPVTDIQLNIKLDKEVLLYPREDFFIVIYYPRELMYPQGIESKAEKVSNRYFYLNGEQWVDVQGIKEFNKAGLMILAGERKPDTQDLEWLKITSGKEGNITVDSSDQIDLLFDSKLVKSRGSHNANIVITSNDTSEPIVKVPAILHVNEAPVFVVDSDKVTVPENTQKEVNILIKDSENNDFDLTLVPEMSKLFNYTFIKNANRLKVILSPDYGDQGFYEYKFKAVDEFGAEGEFTLKVEVTKSNRAPVYIGDDAIFIFKNLGELNEYKITELFADPDGDAISYTAENNNKSVTETFFGKETFVIKAIQEGNSQLNFIVTDDKGASTAKTINVVVNPGGHNVYPNPFTDNLYTMELEGNYEIYGFSGMKLKEGNFTNGTIPLKDLVKGSYHIKIMSKQGRVIKQKIVKL